MQKVHNNFNTFEVFFFGLKHASFCSNSIDIPSCTSIISYLTSLQLVQLFIQQPKAKFEEVGTFFTNRFPSLGIFVNRKVGIR